MMSIGGSEGKTNKPKEVPGVEGVGIGIKDQKKKNQLDEQQVLKMIK